MGGDLYLDDATLESQERQNALAWVQARIQNVHNKVTAEQVLSRFGVEVRSSDRKQQIFCPFHGNTNTMAASYFPASDGKPDAVWCYVCQKQWDAITLWRKFQGLESEKFTKALFTLERAFGLAVPDAPPRRNLSEVLAEREAKEVDRIFEITERRLRGAKPAFTCRPYVKLGALLDHLAYDWRQRTVQAVKVHSVLRQVLDKIAEREAAHGQALDDPHA